ncbi:uncharacterized protein LOC129592675 [Paramacrobiotus metropolitanus]|uniref:uncharacterized protein LOC129592675 n=1 Tax=Paramacrobiotus metropolitanus TaxID=2943436 RepID=UPI002445D22E|nr:uncharacterized protein LOC129592675 [Paramacrobiotus metropolitanus]
MSRLLVAVFLASVVAVCSAQNSTTPTVMFKLERYSNPNNQLQDGSNCDPFGWSKCDPYVVVHVRNSANVTDLQTFTSTPTNDVSSLDFQMFIGFVNPLLIKVPKGTVVDLSVTIYDDDDIGQDEIIGTYWFLYVAGTEAKRETKTAGSASLTVMMATVG